VSNQPWGIFFVNFEPKRLPVVVLRRVLRSLVLKKRQSSNKAQQAAWQLHDLLFISSYGAADHRDITFAHFAEPPELGDLPTLRVLGWDDEDTVLHLEHTDRELREKLRWPTNTKDIDAWRGGWSGAFTLRHKEAISTSKALAVRLADLATKIRKRANAVLRVESESGPFRKLYAAFRETLVHDLSEDDFADMYAQTISYGLLTARISSPAGLFAENLRDMVPVTNPFLKELLETFITAGGRKGKIDFDELGVSEVVQMLRDAKMEDVLRDFGDRNPQEDPAIHFYELFLKEYDPEKRMQRGVFYTPRPVVSFIVRSVDAVLRRDFGLVDGLADIATWGAMAEGHADIQIPEGTSPKEHFVQILDPAVGTGTFLVEVIEVIHRTMQDKWRKAGHMPLEFQNLWNEYVPKHLLPRLHGFELMMAPYAIAHMKIGLKLHETGYRFASNERARVYLTNSLEPPLDFSDRLAFDAPALAHEAQAVNATKHHQRFTVVIGNPPYANYSANLSPSARRIVDKYRNFRGAPIRERNQLQFERNLQDDFVKFISIGEDYILASHVGVLSYITNATMLASTSLRGMREHLVQEFGRLFELNLHGGVNEIIVGPENDENVFDIAQSVAIHVCVRVAGKRIPTVGYADLLGQRAVKYAALSSRSVATTEWSPIQPDLENCSFVPQDEAELGTLLRLDSVFAQFGAGIKTNRDAIAIGFDDGSLVKAIREFDSHLVSDRNYRKHIHSLLYRPFDIRRIFYHSWIRRIPTFKEQPRGPSDAGERALLIL